MAKPRHGVEFGSDSFLDVLANIVGILIILIVTAGTQIGRTPVVPVVPPSALDSRSDQSLAPVAAIAPITRIAPQPEPVVVEAEPDPEPLGPDEPPAEIVDRLAMLDAALSDMDSKTALTQKELADLAALADAAKKSADEHAAKLDERRDALTRQRALASQLQKEVKRSQNDLSGILAEFEVVQKSKGNVKELKHTLTPISQMIEGPELHFRLAENRIAAIPLEEFVERLKVQIERQKDWLARHRRQEGTVGPIRGFTMQYLVEAKSLSAFEELRHGQGAFRIGVSQWEIIPEPDLEAETAAEALRPGSRFAQALNAAPDNASLTMWVYPDSYSCFRKLQSAAHGAGYVVSGRPLPVGAPIAGSPNGSRSVGQ